MNGEASSKVLDLGDLGPGLANGATSEVPGQWLVEMLVESLAWPVEILVESLPWPVEILVERLASG